MAGQMLLLMEHEIGREGLMSTAFTFALTSLYSNLLLTGHAPKKRSQDWCTRTKSQLEWRSLLASKSAMK